MARHTQSRRDRPQTGEVNDIITVARDNRRHEPRLEALREREVLYRSVFDSAAQPVALATADGTQLIRVNQSFCTLLGYSKSEMRELSIDDITHPADRYNGASLAARAANSDSKQFDYVKRYIRKDGGTVQVRVSVVQVCEADGQPHYLICHIQQLLPNPVTEDDAP
ncbi:hypothetical protein CAI21_00135 [Alkalilimnicola ehrlichii]|uniref:histidine kinase n=1 Tax=Alkalilimnicola ehrlichii TaxID=351052 RepID=A0A3E0X476_9GAMM|nr:PAS domain S-box protein [Alkalilimnicola ehrlichii]RFA31114.1 hypothetical protein CAI21_00135 [Alkalilimnicola ehrlichii]RFA39652.1 hypothetical protein CAL65_02270 [Alkalilimnicola ehrlichii]